MKNLSYVLVVAIVVALVVGGCCGASPTPSHQKPYENQIFRDNITNGLDSADRAAFYHLSEGIDYIPYDLLLSLRRPKDSGLGLYDELFFASSERLGLMPDYISGSEAPVGITKSEAIYFSMENYVVSMAGINCATCHTALITKNGNMFYVDGTNGLFAIDRFIKEMIFSMISTLICPSEFESFYQRYRTRVQIPDAEDVDYDFVQDILESQNLGDTSCDQITLNSEFGNKIVSLESTLRLLESDGEFSTQLPEAYPLFSQLDSRTEIAIYMIKKIKFFLDQTDFASNPNVTQVADSGLGRANPWSSSKNLLANKLLGKEKEEWLNEDGGPLNIPYIFNFNKPGAQSKWIFASGVTNSMLQRNYAQGIALLTDFNWSTDPSQYESTVSIRKLHQISKYVERIHPPLWNSEVLGSLDLALVDRGKTIFQKHCLGCHTAHQTAGGFVEFQYIDVGTDDEYIRAQTESFYGLDLFADILAPWLNDVTAAMARKEGIFDLPSYDRGVTQPIWRRPAGNHYAARPLYGVWATAPYLHNGSVLNITELLKPARQRLTEFWVGSLEYDTENLGFLNQEVWYGSRLQTNCENCRGNSNRGHEYGTELSSEDKRALIEFLKEYNESTKFE